MSALLLELAEALGRYDSLRCRPSVETDEDGYVVLTVRVKPDDQLTVHQAAKVLELGSELQYVCDVAQMRLYAEKYNIDPALLEAALNGGRHGA